MNANDQLRDYNGTDNYFKHPLGIIYTDGVHELCHRFQCWWFLDVIGSYQGYLKNDEFQVWSLGKNDDESAIVICTDGNDGILITQEIPWTDFAAKEATIWVENGVALLPSEH